jgi:type II secretory pathway pseudopilin PulG
MKNRRSLARATRAFTLVEVMLSMGIFTALAAMILTLVMGVTRSLVDSQNKGENDRSFRTTTSEISQLVGASDFVYVMDSADGKTALNPNQTGDLLVAVYYRNPGYADPVSGKFDTTVARITGFCRLPRDDGKAEGGPVYCFDSAKNSWGTTFPTTSDGTPESIAKLLPDSKQIRSFTKLANNAFSTDATGKIFINNNSGTGALMLARIRNGSPGRYVSNTYAFSVSSRNL